MYRPAGPVAVVPPDMHVRMALSSRGANIRLEVLLTLQTERM